MDEQSNCHYSSDMRDVLADRIAEALDNPDARPIVLGMLSEYEITAKETGLVVYNGGETDYLIKRFIVAKKVKGCTDRTCENYLGFLNRFFRTVGKSPTQCQHTDVQAFIADLIIRKTSKAHQQNAHHVLSSFYSWLTKEEIVPKNIMLKVDTIKVKPPKKKAFSDMDVEKIRAACKTKRQTALVEVLLSTGCRVFEVGKLRRDECQGETIDIIGKGDKPRTVYLNAKAQLAIQGYLAERTDDNPWLFPASIQVGHNLAVEKKGFIGAPNRTAGWYLKPEYVSPDSHQDNSALECTIRTIGKRAGVPECHPHRFRRTCATFALRRGMSLVLVQQMLGHESLETTRRYLDITEDELKEAHRKYVT